MNLQNLAGLLALRGVGTLLTFGVSVVVARLHGAAGFGFYSLFVSVCAGLLLVAKFGADNVMVRDVSIALSKGKPGEATGSWLATLAGALAISGAIIIFLTTIGARPLASIFSPTDTPNVIWHIALMLCPAAILAINLGAIRGGGKIALASLLEMIILPGSILLALTTLSLSPLTAYVLATGVAATASLLALLKSVPLFTRPARPDFAALFRNGWYVVGVSLVDFISNWSGSYALALWQDEAAVGVFNACWRLVIAINMVMLVLDQINGPRFAALHSAGNRTELEYCVRQTATIGAVIACVTWVALLVAGPWILGWFGPEFRAGHLAIVILACGQFISLCCGSTGYLLIMTDHGRLLRNINAAVLIAQLASLPWLATNWGVEGAALASATSVALNKLLTAAAASRVLGISVHPSKQLLRALCRQVMIKLTGTRAK
jgi:O-antigen/teichoic acid export membrane protein